MALRARPTDWTEPARIIVDQAMKLSSGTADKPLLVHAAEEFVSYVLGRIYPSGAVLAAPGKDYEGVATPVSTYTSWEGVAACLKEQLEAPDAGRKAINWKPIALLILTLLQQLISAT